MAKSSKKAGAGAGSSASFFDKIPTWVLIASAVIVIAALVAIFFPGIIWIVCGLVCLLLFFTFAIFYLFWLIPIIVVLVIIGVIGGIVYYFKK